MSKLDTALDAALGHDLAAAFEQWLAVDEPAWGRQSARRLTEAQAACSKQEAP